MTQYVRWRAGEERRSPVNRFAPLEADHPLVGAECHSCCEPLLVGQRPSLFAVGPENPYNSERADAGDWYTAMAVPLHQTCAWPSIR